MATKDTQLEQIIFNTMSQEKYDELKANGQINPNEIYLVPDTNEVPENVVQSDNYENAKLWKGTLAEYEALGTYDDSITYIITDDIEELDVYTKQEVDEKLENVTVDLSDYATISNVEALVSPKADKTEIPTKVSELENDSGYISEADVDLDSYATKTYVTTEVSSKADKLYVDNNLELKANKGDIPANVSAFNNDAGYLTEHQDISGKADITYVDDGLTQKADKETTYTKTEVDNLLSPKATTEYVNEELGKKADKSEIPTIPTNVSDFNNDAGYLTSIPSEYVTETELNAKGYLTEHQDISGKADTTYVNEELGKKADKTEIGNGVLTIQKNGVEVAQFSANQSGNITANIEADVQVNADWNATSGVAQILNKPTNVSAFNNDAGYLTEHQDISGKADKATTLAGYGIADAYTKSEVDAKISSVYRYVGSVATYNALPTEGNVVGDVYNVEDTGDNYAWNGTGWDKLAGDIDLTPYLTKDEASTTYATIASVSSHTTSQTNPHNVTKSQVGLGNVDNTSDANKPISTATQSALDLKANDNQVVHVSENETINGVKTFVSSPIVPTIADLTESSQNVASTKFVQDVVNANKTTITYWD